MGDGIEPEFGTRLAQTREGGRARLAAGRSGCHADPAGSPPTPPTGVSPPTRPACCVPPPPTLFVLSPPPLPFPSYESLAYPRPHTFTHPICLRLTVGVFPPVLSLVRRLLSPARSANRQQRVGVLDSGGCRHGRRSPWGAAWGWRQGRATALRWCQRRRCGRCVATGVSSAGATEAAP